MSAKWGILRAWIENQIKGLQHMDQGFTTIEAIRHQEKELTLETILDKMNELEA